MKQGRTKGLYSTLLPHHVGFKKRQHDGDVTFKNSKFSHCSLSKISLRAYFGFRLLLSNFLKSSLFLFDILKSFYQFSEYAAIAWLILRKTCGCDRYANKMIYLFEKGFQDRKGESREVLIFRKYFQFFNSISSRFEEKQN